MTAERVEGPGDFDVWFTGRAAALTRFAFALVGEETAAETALRSALAKAGSSWSQLRRADDPEGEVRRLVVQAFLANRRGRRRNRAVPPVARVVDAADGAAAAELAWRFCASLPPVVRAALVLRSYAESTYPQIAAAIGTRVSTARGYVEEALDALGNGFQPTLAEPQVETLLRGTLEERAEAVPELSGWAASVHEGVATSRRRRWRTAVACATAVLVAGTVAIVASQTTSSSTAAGAGGHPRGWRAESYHGVELWVPSSWGWGETPQSSPHGLVSCHSGAHQPTLPTVSVHWIPSGYPLPPYVGRPLPSTGRCRPAEPITAAHVWFDSPLPVGSSGTQTTVRVPVSGHPVTVTVGDPNAAERAMIVGSLRVVGTDAHGCPRDAAGLTRLEALAEAAPMPNFVTSVSLCLFGTDAAQHQVLFYSTEVAGSAARSATARIEDTPVHRSDEVCLVTPAMDAVVLVARTPTVPAVFNVFPGACPHASAGYVTGSSFHVLTRRSLPLWQIDGLAVYAGKAPHDSGLTPYLPHS